MFEEIKEKHLSHLRKEYQIATKTVEYVVDLIEANSLDRIFHGYSKNEIYLKVENALKELYLNYPFTQPSRKKNVLSEKLGWEEFSPKPKLTEVGRAVVNQYRKFIGQPTIENLKKEIEKNFSDLSKED